jgi:ComF family protein
LRLLETAIFRNFQSFQILRYFFSYFSPKESKICVFFAAIAAFFLLFVHVEIISVPRRTIPHAKIIQRKTVQTLPLHTARSAVSAIVRLFGESALNVFSPPHCLTCGAALCEEYGEAKISPLRSVCLRCFDRLPPAQSPETIALQIERSINADDRAIRRFIARFQRHDALNFHRENNENHENDDDRETPIEPILYAMKYGGAENLCRDGGRELGRHILAHAFENYDAVVPVPIHAARRRERGYNQAERIAEGVAEILNTPLCATTLRRVRYTPSQTLLTRNERARNVRDAFRVNSRQKLIFKGLGVLLVDDILTSGATMNACAHELLCAGARFVDAATVFRA